MKADPARLLLLCAAAASLWGCASGRSATAGPAGHESAQGPHGSGAAVEPQGPGLRFLVTPPEAEVVVNGDRLGTAGDLARPDALVKVAPGIHRVVLRAPGYQTWRAEVAVEEAVELIQVGLQQIQATKRTDD
jgi:hypothetical protein